MHPWALGRATRWLSMAAALAAALVVAPPGHGAARAAAPNGGLPHYDHVAVLVLENENEAATYGAASKATYLRSLVAQGAFDPNYYATGHVSLDNYIAMVSAQGANPLSSTDCAAVNMFLCVQPQTAFAGGRNLADQLESAGLSWKGYMDSMPAPCFHADYSPPAPPPDPYQGNSTAAPAGNYADRHNPFLYFADIIGNDARCKAHVVPFPQLSTDLSASALPAFSFITPDTCHDGHDDPCAGQTTGGLAAADLWLSQKLPPLLSYLNAHNGLLLITTDEASTSDLSGCCHGGPLGAAGFGGKVGLLALGPHTRAGQTVQTSYDHASQLRTIEDLFGISEHLNNAAASADMSDLFSSRSSPGPGPGGGPGVSAVDAPGSDVAAASVPGLSNTSAATVPPAPVIAAAAIILGAVLILGRRRRRRAPLPSLRGAWPRPGS
jgi:phospholipase C